MAGVKKGLRKDNRISAARKRFCANPFSKLGHSNWKSALNLVKLTENLVIKFAAIGYVDCTESENESPKQNAKRDNHQRNTIVSCFHTSG